MESKRASPVTVVAGEESKESKEGGSGGKDKKKKKKKGGKGVGAADKENAGAPEEGQEGSEEEVRVVLWMYA